MAAAAFRGDLVAYVCATSITTIHYIARKQVGTGAAADAIGKLLEVFQVAAVNDTVLRHAIAREFSDFEDAVVDAAAEHVGATAIVTRDPDGFRNSGLTIFSPTELVQVLVAK
ncbi:MAG: PIN domain-containing protein [Myxococcota bacterium]